MPRKRKSDMTQPIQAPTGRAYGARQQLVDAQRAVPLPEQAPAPAAQDANPFAAAMQAAQDYQMGGPSLAGPTMRPGEPVTAGSPLGAGPGPEVLGAPISISQTFFDLADELDDDDLRAYASLIGQIGL